MFLVVLLMLAGASAEPTTTKTYDIDVPGAEPIRIVEGEPLWERTTIKPESKFEHRSFNTFTTDRSSSNINSPLEEDALQKFLSNYAENFKRNKIQQSEENLESVEMVTKADQAPSNRFGGLLITQSGDAKEKPKSWDLLHHQKHHHPYEDKKGWVSMEPVPWSVSKISKWQSSHKTTQRPYFNDYNSDDSAYSEVLTKPWPSKPFRPYETAKPSPNYDVFYVDKKPEPHPVFAKPSAVFAQKVHVNYGHGANYHNHHTHDENCHHNEDESPDIITDGLPANFPQTYEANRRRGSEIHTDTHPFSGEGDWVLLSTTKGYKYPQQRQRSLQIQPDSIGAHRTVRLTVLPPLKNSKVNMTTSHGGLLQVESTFETVEQAQRQHLKRQKLKKKPQRVIKQINKNKPVRQIVAPTTVTKRNTGPDTSAVLAAVGAGMIPATMAMLVPMAMGGRRKREARFSTTHPLSSVEITLPRTL